MTDVSKEDPAFKPVSASDLFPSSSIKDENAEALLKNTHKLGSNKSLAKDPNAQIPQPLQTSQQLIDRLMNGKLVGIKLSDSQKVGMAALALRNKGMDSKQYEDATKLIADIINH